MLALKTFNGHSNLLAPYKLEPDWDFLILLYHPSYTYRKKPLHHYKIILLAICAYVAKKFIDPLLILLVEYSLARNRSYIAVQLLKSLKSQAIELS